VTAIRRTLKPPVAAAVIGILLAVPLAAAVGFSVSYVARGHRIAELEAMVCRERVARLAPLKSELPCPEAEKILAHALPQVWTPIAQTRSDQRFGTAVIRWRVSSTSTASR
jgi:hypothetical protein